MRYYVNRKNNTDKNMITFRYGGIVFLQVSVSSENHAVTNETTGQSGARTDSPPGSAVVKRRARAE